MPINRTGFLQTADALTITKDPEAQLVYTFDWSEWLATGDGLDTVEYTAVARRNDPAAVTIESSGITDDKTYVEISGGAVEKTYIVTCKVTTTDGLVDRRNFRLEVANRPG